jgi:hypothetical protein
MIPDAVTLPLPLKVAAFAASARAPPRIRLPELLFCIWIALSALRLELTVWVAYPWVWETRIPEGPMALDPLNSRLPPFSV